MVTPPFCPPGHCLLITSQRGIQKGASSHTINQESVCSATCRVTHKCSLFFRNPPFRIPLWGTVSFIWGFDHKFTNYSQNKHNSKFKLIFSRTPLWQYVWYKISHGCFLKLQLAESQPNPRTDGYTILYYTILYYTVLYCTTLLYSTILYHIIV